MSWDGTTFNLYSKVSSENKNWNKSYAKFHLKNPLRKGWVFLLCEKWLFFWFGSLVKQLSGCKAYEVHIMWKKVKYFNLDSSSAWWETQQWKPEKLRSATKHETYISQLKPTPISIEICFFRIIASLGLAFPLSWPFDLSLLAFFSASLPPWFIGQNARVKSL